MCGKKLDSVLSTITLNRKFGRKLSFFVKLTVTSAICSIILWTVDWFAIFKGLQESNPVLIFTVFVLMLLSVTISAYKWQVILSIHDVNFDFRKLHQYYFVAMFLNNLLPSTIGGDGYRIYKTLDNSKSKSSAVVAVFVERITGVLALLFLGYIGGIISFAQGRDSLSRIVVVIGTIALIILISLIYYAIKFKSPNFLLRRGGYQKIIYTIISHVEDYRRKPYKSLEFILISILFQIHSLGFNFLAIVALGKMCSIFNLAVVVALTNVIATLPISINGIGLMEGSFMYLIGKYNIDSETALLAIIIIRALLIPISLIGGVFYLREKQAGYAKTAKN